MVTEAPARLRPGTLEEGAAAPAVPRLSPGTFRGPLLLLSVPWSPLSCRLVLRAERGDSWCGGVAHGEPLSCEEPPERGVLGASLLRGVLEASLLASSSAPSSAAVAGTYAKGEREKNGC